MMMVMLMSSANCVGDAEVESGTPLTMMTMMMLLRIPPRQREGDK